MNRYFIWVFIEFCVVTGNKVQKIYAFIYIRVSEVVIFESLCEDTVKDICFAVKRYWLDPVDINVSVFVFLDVDLRNVWAQVVLNGKVEHVVLVLFKTITGYLNYFIENRV